MWRVRFHLWLMAFTVVSVVNVYAQGVRVLVQNGKSATEAKPMVHVKWYSQQFIYRHGVNVYRRPSGEDSWMKLNSSPIVLQQRVPPQLLQRDEDLDSFLQMANELSATEKDGFLLLNLFVKTFQSHDFSRLVGIQYDDQTAEWGKSYQYRITALPGRGSEETELAVSEAFTAGGFRPAGPVREFAVRFEKGVAKMNWQAEERRFYGANIYRRTSLDTTWRKLNKTPIVQSETPGAPASDAMFHDVDLRERVIYYYRIAGLDFFGEETALSETATLPVGDLTPPPAPLNPGRRVSVLDVTVTWEIHPSEDLAGFHVYRSNKSEGPFSRVTTNLLSDADTSFVDVVPQPGFYYYYVAAIDAAGNESVSFTILAEVQDVIPPAAPVNVIAKSDTGKITVQWKANVEPDMLGYHIFRTINEDQKNNFVLINAEPLRDTFYVQVLPENASNDFLFKVVAVDTILNRSEPSEVVSSRLPDVTPPIKPFVKSVTLNGDSVIIAWLENPENDLSGFNVYRYEDGQERMKINSILIDANQLYYHDTITAGGTYYYQLEAVDKTGNASELSDPHPLQRQEVFTFRFADVRASYHKRKKAVQISWSGTGKKPVGYALFRKSMDDITFKPLTGMVKTTNYEDKQVLKKTNYLYQIRAYSRDGGVAVSSAVNIKTGK